MLKGRETDLYHSHPCQEEKEKTTEDSREARNHFKL